MADVIEIAQERKARIAAEIAKLDNFIAMAVALLRQEQPGSKPASGDETISSGESTGPRVVRSNASTASADRASHELCDARDAS